MKPTPTADYPVRVRSMQWEVGGQSAHLYKDAYEATLNGLVSIAFVPEISVPVGAWDADLLPDDFDTIDDQQGARLAVAVGSKYVVTPVDAPQGCSRFRCLDDGPGERTGVAFLVTRGTFAQFQKELYDMSTFLGAVTPDYTISTLRPRAVITFIENEIVPSDAFAPKDAHLLGAGGPPPT